MRMKRHGHLYFLKAWVSGRLRILSKTGNRLSTDYWSDMVYTSMSFRRHYYICNSNQVRVRTGFIREKAILKKLDLWETFIIVNQRNQQDENN
jgi:hypothetical protein